MKQCEEHLQKEKRKVLNIAHNKGEILHLFKESKEFIDTSHNMKYEQKHHHNSNNSNKLLRARASIITSKKVKAVRICHVILKVIY